MSDPTAKRKAESGASESATPELPGLEWTNVPLSERLRESALPVLTKLLMDICEQENGQQNPNPKPDNTQGNE